MRQFIIDCETVPLVEKSLLALMPPEIASPVMPEAIKNPPPPDLGKCPVYGGDVAKQDAWKAKAQAEWKAKTESAQIMWEEKAVEAKQKFIDDAALSPITGTVKLIGIKDCESGIAHIAVAGATPMQKKMLEAATYPTKIELKFWEDERSMLASFSSNVNRGTVIDGKNDGSSDFKLINFYGEQFDFPFIFKRCWYHGCTAPWMLRKGRYWRDDISVDLHNLFTFGDRSQKTGGLDMVAKFLGTRRKSGSGEHFYRLWESDPLAAVLYLLDDLSCTEEAATKMGIVRKAKL